MASAWLMDSRGLAKKVKNACEPAADQIKDCGAVRECPNCHYQIDNSDVSPDWPGFPAGVKFDPSDVELLENLAAKCGVGNLKPHMLIDEFIPTLEGDNGICYRHPENLPGAKKDGSSVYFFYRPRNAYASGKRKRRRIHDQENTTNTSVCWQKTGKTRPVMKNGVQKGCQKIMVLKSTSRKGSKPENCNWVMYQYHLGTDKDEKEGEYVVSKIFFKPPRDTDKIESSLEVEESDIGTVQVIPRTPKTNTPEPPRLEKTPTSVYGSDDHLLQSLEPPRLEETPTSVCCSDDYLLQSLIQETENLKEPAHPSDGSVLEDKMEYATCLAAGSEDVLGGADSLFCDEIIDSFATFNELRPDNVSSTQVGSNMSDVHQRDISASCDIGDLNNLELNNPPDFLLTDLQFASQDSVFDWLDRL
ncbi:hypothetical protein CDL12_09414 [Handroanthus impetiginosus]|uniref:NAC domain-containing protein n=1 Tax=Handroanthus impetiginosus TaxID=429701 RepID=A0A2G9HK81_9LAMI|nr:hypothetical protein CDL12_09414 [Handroanthus impetiginosus]